MWIEAHMPLKKCFAQADQRRVIDDLFCNLNCPMIGAPFMTAIEDRLELDDAEGFHRESPSPRLRLEHVIK